MQMLVYLIENLTPRTGATKHQSTFSQLQNVKSVPVLSELAAFQTVAARCSSSHTLGVVGTLFISVGGRCYLNQTNKSKSQQLPCADSSPDHKRVCGHIQLTIKMLILIYRDYTRH